MVSTFQIRPVGLQEGFTISCEGVLQKDAHRARLIDAIVHAVHLGRDLEGKIEIYDDSGRRVELLPLPAALALAD